MTTFVLLCVCSFLAVGTLAFKPTIGQGDDPSMYTHESITQKGVDRAAAKFLISSGILNTSTTDPQDIVKEYFGSDTNSYVDYQQRRQDFSVAVMNVYKTYHTNPDYTVNSERIHEAHNLVKMTRLEIASILSSGPLNDAKMNLLMAKVGKCLMIIQSFYSNTNWIEMMVNGGETFLNFGTIASFTMNVAASGTDTCRNCDYSMANSCNDNLLVHDRLTSGYLYGQLNYPKPVANSLATEGKCSHGGVNDLGKNTAATGGINKETPDWSWSPHAHLHNISGLTAVRATEAFFIDSTSGVLGDADQTIMKDIFKLNKALQDKSMGFVIDVTGSMSDDIKSVKRSLISTLSSVIGTPNAPSNYVLSTFNDPANLTTVNTTTDGDEMIRWIDELTVYGGGDCPEYAMSGILAAIGACKPNSNIYIATDADAKDEYLTNTTIQQANAKHIKLKFILTSTCYSSIRRRRDIQKRGLSAFQQLVSNTGGSVLNINHSDVTSVLDNVLKEDFPSSEAIIDCFVQTTLEDDTMDITVDSDTAVLVITIKGPYTLSQASLALPNGTVQTFRTKHATQYYSSHTVTMSIQRPSPGTWKLTRIGGDTWTVNVTASTYMYIDSQLKETDNFGISYVVDRNPIVGKNYTLEVLAYNLNSSSSAFTIILVDEQGSILSNQHLDLIFSSSKSSGYLPIKIPSKNFYVQLSGIDPNGFQFKRISRNLITPVGVDLIVKPIIGNLDIGTPHDITYTIRNLGDSAQTYTVSIVDDKGRVHSPTTRQHKLVAGTSVSGHFQILSSVQLEYVTYTVSVKLPGSGSVLQSSTSTAMFTGALCSSLVTKACALADTGSNCSLVTWSATAVFSFNVSTYTSDTNVQMTIDSTDRKRLHVSGTCCLDNITVSAKPSTGKGCETLQRVITLDEEFVDGNKGNGPHSHPVPSTSSNTLLIVVTVVPITTVAALVGFAIHYKVTAKKNKTKTTDSKEKTDHSADTCIDSTKQDQLNNKSF
ncbi:von Willebrand factor A domain-containing protein 7-like [Pecten maximus]|uniref:von Willebrand factor A domain-containing protein 7-like n=1 Tax=Pecten maximus TaxID=6579 RepID=UPI00145855F3|nr:von Willebrand factor A domain-containing protein 7-like [Pecten maximus]